MTKAAEDATTAEASRLGSELPSPQSVIDELKSLNPDIPDDSARVRLSPFVRANVACLC